MKHTNIILIAIVAIVGLPIITQAQYYAGTDQGFNVARVSDEPATALTSPHPLVLAAQAVSGLDLDALIVLEPGMSRRFQMAWNTSADAEYFAEELVTAVNPVVRKPDYDPVVYEIYGEQVYLGVGRDPTEDEYWQPATIATFMPDGNGGLTELSRHQAGAEYCDAVFVLDMTGNGVLEVVLTWATGVGGGGGVDVVSIVPTGGLSPYSEDEYSTSFFSQWGYVNLLNYDGDDKWEFEVVYPLIGNWAPYSVSTLKVYNPEDWTWHDATGIFPDYYEPQINFYSTLLNEIHGFAKHPEDYLVDKDVTDEVYLEWGYACLIDGEWYTLEPFIMGEGGGINKENVDMLEYMLSKMQGHKSP